MENHMGGEEHELKNIIEIEIEEAKIARYENKAEALSEVLNMFKTGVAHAQIKEAFEAVEAKRPRVL